MDAFVEVTQRPDFGNNSECCVPFFNGPILVVIPNFIYSK